MLSEIISVYNYIYKFVFISSHLQVMRLIRRVYTRKIYLEKI